MLDYRHSQFLTSANGPEGFPAPAGPEVAFAGRSNAGKSSAINRIIGVHGLARTSKTPGRTQLINFFDVDGQRRLVDLPGYGFAKVPVKVQAHWRDLMESYLGQRATLGGIFLIMDIRHPLKPFDLQMLEWAQYHEIPVHGLLTKADKLTRNHANQALAQVRRSAPWMSVQTFSATNGLGVDEARGVLDRWFGVEGGIGGE